MSKILEGNIIKKPNQSQSYTKKQIDELKRCSTGNPDGHLYFMENFGYLKHPEKGRLLFKPFDYQKKLIANYHENRFSINMLGRQLGKASMYDEPVLTPEGFVEMQHLSVGDYVYGADGKKTRIVSKTDRQDNRTCYRVTFDNGESITVDAEHEWKVFDSDLECSEVVTTKELLGRKDTYIPVTEPIVFESQPISSDPYAIGTDVRLGERGNIPKEYLFNSIEIRNKLLKGLVGDNLSFSHTDPEVVKDVRFLLSTLGIKSSLENNETESKIIIYKYNSEHHRVVSITEVDSVPVYCIEVASHDHLFLIGETLIPTHNCTTGDTMITMRNKITSEIITLPIGEFFDMIRRGNE